MKSLSRKVKRARPLLGTYVTIELHGEIEEDLLHQFITEGFDTIAEIDCLMSYHRRESDLTRLNQASANVWVNLSSLTVEVLRASNELWTTSDGVFDIRCGAVLAKRGLLPSFSTDRTARCRISGNELPLEIKGRCVRKSGPWILDLGGIAKGYAVDRAVEKIRQLSSELLLSGIVNAGGDAAVWGDSLLPMATRIHGKPFFWMRPFNVQETAVATSSVLEQAAHVQMPSAQFLQNSKTVTVFAPTCVLADALTKIVLLGSADVVARCLFSHEARALIFSSDGQLEKWSLS